MKAFGLLSVFPALFAPLAGAQGLVEAIVHINTFGQEVSPFAYEWGRVATQEKGVAQPRHCGIVDGSGRLGKRQTCPGGYTLSCNLAEGYPCCPESAPLCCSESQVCCPFGTFCTGTSACCSYGQKGCGDACCESDQECCGSNCCNPGFTCSDGQCVSPSTTLSPTLSATESQGTPRVNTGTETVTVTITPSNPYDPEVTTVTETTTVTDGGEGGGDDGGDGGGSSPSTPVVAGIVGACLGALCLALVAVAAWMTKRKKDCERELNDIKGNNNGYNGTEGAPPTSAGYKEASGTT